MYNELKKEQNLDLLILLFIVAVGGILRFYNFSNIPMTHDELSAYYRLNFSSLKELIEYGVKGDGHPAGIQVFLFFWTNLFGSSDTIIKLPFLLMGLGSILLAYQVSKQWFNSTSALFVAAYMASLQYTVMYSQMARPYISGLFFCLLMVLFWTRVIFVTNKKRIPSLIGFVLSAAACCYIHHFSLLFTAIVCFTGLFYLEKENRVHYILSLIAIILLYIPHINIFFYQLNMEGLNWLGKPANSFFLDYLKYIFHFSIIMYLSVFILFTIGVCRNLNQAWPFNKFQYISIIWFVIPPIVGFIYSKLISPVIQYSVLIFSFPFLLIFLFSFFKPFSKWFKIIAVSVMLIINVSTLVWTRQHYDIFYKQPFNEYAILTKDFMNKHDAENVRIVFQENPQYINHYFSGLNPGIDFISIFDKKLNPVEFRRIISSISTEYLICGGIPLEYIPIIKEYYPNLMYKDFGFTYEYYIFSMNKLSPEKSMSYIPVFSENMDFENEHEHWDISMCSTKDLLQHSFCSLDSTHEWGPKFENSLVEITKSKHDIIDIALEFKGDSNGLIVCEIFENSKRVLWQGSQLQSYYDSTKTNEWQKAYLSIRLTSLFKKDRDVKDCKIKIYYWNNVKSNIILDNFNIKVREGNHKIYSLIESI